MRTATAIWLATVRRHGVDILYSVSAAILIGFHVGVTSMLLATSAYLQLSAVVNAFIAVAAYRYAVQGRSDVFRGQPSFAENAFLRPRPVTPPQQPSRRQRRRPVQKDVDRRRRVLDRVLDEEALAVGSGLVLVPDVDHGGDLGLEEWNR